MPSSKNILALDLATTTGWAALVNGGILSGSAGFDRDIGRMAKQLEDWLNDWINLDNVATIYAEEPIPARTKTTQNVLIRAHGMHVIVRKVCEEHVIPCHFVRCDDWRKHFIGGARAPREIKKAHARRKWLKEAVISECEARGLNPRNNDEGDALGILSFAVCRELPDEPSMCSFAGAKTTGASTSRNSKLSGDRPDAGRKRLHNKNVLAA